MKGAETTKLSIEPTCAEPPCGGPKIEAAGFTHIGSRNGNQDHYLISDLNRLLTVQDSRVSHEHRERLVSDQRGNLLVVADGMGGHAGGAIASETAIQAICDYVREMMHWFLRPSATHEESFQDVLAEILRVAQERLKVTSAKTSQPATGTTVTMASVLGDKM